MATPAERPSPYTHNISFDYDVEPAENDRVELIAGRKVQKVSQVGASTEVGEVVNVRSALKECTVRTTYANNHQTRIAGEAVVPGRFVFGPDNTVYQYIPASPAHHDGTTTGPKTVTVDVDDTVKVKFDGVSTTIVLTAGVGITFAAIAAELNAELVGCKAVVDAAGNLNLVGTQIGKTVEIEADAHGAYALLGWTAGVYYPTNASHDPTAVAGMIVVGGALGAAVETLEW